MPPPSPRWGYTRAAGSGMIGAILPPGARPMSRSPLARLSLAATSVALLVGVAVLAHQAPPAGGPMAAAADGFLTSLPAELKAKAAQPFDSPNREQWFFTPQQTKDKQPLRKGRPAGRTRRQAEGGGDGPCCGPG